MKTTKYVNTLKAFEKVKKEYETMLSELYNEIRNHETVKMSAICQEIETSKQMLRLKFIQKKVKIFEVKKILKFLAILEK